MDVLSRTLEERVAVVESRLDGGSKAFAEIRSEAAVSRAEMQAGIAKLAPKPTDWSRLLFAFFSASIAVGGCIYTLAEKLSERTTNEQFEDGLLPLREAQKSSARRIEELRVLQYEQRAAISALEKDIEAQALRLNGLKKRR